MAENFKVDPKEVYTTKNISSVMKDSNKSLQDLDIDKLELAYRDAQNLKGLQNEQIMNRPIAMPVLTGQAAHMGRLWDLKIDAIGSLYQAKESQLQREEAERQNFIAQYGADPSQRPKGMSKREFSAALSAGQFSNLLTEDFKQKKLETEIKRKSLAGGGAAGSLKSSLTEDIYAGVKTREAAKAIYEAQYGEGTGNWVYTAAPDDYESAITNTSAEAKKQADWEAAEKFVADNQNADREEIKIELQKNTSLTDGEINTLIDRMGMTEGQIRLTAKGFIEQNFNKSIFRSRESETKIAKEKVLELIEQIRRDGGLLDTKDGVEAYSERDLDRMEEEIKKMSFKDIDITKI